MQREIVDRLFEEDFSTAEDIDIQQDLERKLEALGLDARLAREIIAQSHTESRGPAVAPAAEPFSVIPQRQWEEARRRLYEEVQRTANLLLNRTSLTREGRELPFKLKPEIGATSNYTSALTMVNQSVAKMVGEGRKRHEWSIEEFTEALDQLPNILDRLVREIKKLQNVAQG